MKNNKRIIAIIMAILLAVSAVSFGSGVNATGEGKDENAPAEAITEESAEEKTNGKASEKNKEADSITENVTEEINEKNNDNTSDDVTEDKKPDDKASDEDAASVYDSLILYDKKERKDLDADEVAEAFDINILIDSDYDVTDVKDGIDFDENKVKVTYDEKRSNYKPEKTGTYDTYYIVEPFSGKMPYLIHRKVIVKEPDLKSDKNKDKKSDNSKDDSGDYEKSEDSDESDSKNKSDKSKVIAGEERSNDKDEFPLSVGEIENIQSNTASFGIYLDPGQDESVIEETLDTDYTYEFGTEEDDSSDDNSDSGDEEADGTDTSSASKTRDVCLNEHPTNSVLYSRFEKLYETVLNNTIPTINAEAADSKDSMTVSYAGYVSYCYSRTGIKYISDEGPYKNHLVYCLDFNKDTTDGKVTAGGKVKAQITYCLVNGARTLGGLCHNDKYSTGSADYDYCVTSGAIHVLNGEASLSYYNDGSTVYNKIAAMVGDAKKIDKTKYNLETGLTKSITYTISPKSTKWKEVSDGLYKTTDKIVRTKSGTITDVKYSITNAPEGLTTGEINKDASDIVDEKDLKKYDIAIAQTDKDKASSNFYIYCNQEAMEKIIADNVTLKVQIKVYSNEKGGRKWTPTVVSQQKITFLESFTPVSAKATVKVISTGKLGSFSFQKTDKFKKSPIDGATYYLYEDKDCDDLLCEVVQDPKINGLYGTGVETLTQSKYYLKEVDAPEGYELDETVYEIDTAYFTLYDADGKITQKPTKTFIHDEYPEPISVIVTKKDDFTKKEITTAGFAVFNDEACTVRTIIDAERNPAVVPIFHYNKDLGYAISSKFMKTQDTYYVKEVEVPAGYKEPTSVWKVSPNYGEVAYVQATNQPVRCSVDADKKDKKTGTAQGDATLAGATYGLYASEDIKYPDGSGVVTYKAADPIKSTKGTEFKFIEVAATKGTLLATVKTDAKGEFNFSNLYLGNYYIKEIKESEGYLLDGTTYPVDFKSEKDTKKDIKVVRHVTETVKQQAFEILKVSTDGSNIEIDKVQGAEFTVKLKSDIEKNGWEAAKAYCTLTTNADGYAKSIELPYGTYIVKETKTPKDLYKTADFEVKITEDSRTPQAWRTLNDAPFKAYIRFIKKDKESGEIVLLPGVTFKIRKAGTEEYVEQKVGDKRISEFVTDETGTVTTPLMLKYGDYEVTEVKAPEGYLISEDIISFNVTKDGAIEMTEDIDGDPVISIEIENQPVKGSISIHKSGEVLIGAEYDTIVDRILTAVTGDNRSVRFKYENKPLKDAVYKIIADEDIYTPDNQKDEEGNRKVAVINDIPANKDAVIALLTTDEEGKAELNDLPLGKYRIEEEKAPEGFVLDKEAKHIELRYANDHTEVVYESAELLDKRVKTELKLIKKDSVSETPVQGAWYGVYATADIKSPDGEVLVATDTLINSGITDENGSIAFDAELPLGRYYVKEIETAPGYVTDPNEYEVDFTYQNPEIELLSKEIEVKETPITVEVSKTDVTMGTEIIGAQLEIIDTNGETYAAWNTDGKPHTLNAMPAGKYILKETAAPYGYMIATEAEFTVEETGDIQKVVMKDERVLGNIEIIKTDSETKKPLKGVKFEIRDKKGKVIQKLKTDKKGKAVSKDLSICTYKKNGEYDKNITYVIVETKTKKGYILDEKEHKVVMSYKNTPKKNVKYQLNITNKPEKKTVTKLPQTGGSFNVRLFTASGITLILIGLIIFVLAKKRRYKNNDKA